MAKAEFLRAQYSLDEPMWKQYLIWLGAMPGPDGYSGLLQGDWGWSFEFDQPVSEVLGETLWLTVVVNLAAMLFIYAVSLPLGTIAAVRAGGWSGSKSGRWVLPSVRHPLGHLEIGSGKDPAPHSAVGYWVFWSLGGHA